jgi:hydroxypyruvate isomerase
MVQQERLELVANVSLLFAESPYLQRFERAAAAGFTAVETWWPWRTPTPTASEVDEFVSALETAGLRLAALNFYAGDMSVGDRGIVSLPDRGEEFDANLDVVSDIAERTGVAKFNALYGQRLSDVDAVLQDEVASQRLARAARRVAEFGGTVLVEPLTRGLNGTYPLTTAADGVSVVQRVRDIAGVPGIALLFDTFHLTNNGDDLHAVIDRHGPLIGHVQIADAPGRGEPGTGTVDVPAVVDHLWGAGYRGAIACEYAPTRPREQTLGWISSVPRLAQLA